MRSDCCNETVIIGWHGALCCARCGLRWEGSAKPEPASPEPKKVSMLEMQNSYVISATQKARMEALEGFVTATMTYLDCVERKWADDMSQEEDYLVTLFKALPPKE